MNPRLCQQLDDYVAHDLTDGECQQFVAHLADCPNCRRAVAEQGRIDALLIEATTGVPAGLSEQVERRLRGAQRRRVVVGALAIAASVAAVWLLGHAFHRPAEPDSPVAQTQPEPPTPEAPRPADHVRVTFPAGANVFAVPVKTESPNVTFLWVFADLRAAATVAPVVPTPPLSTERSD